MMVSHVDLTVVMCHFFFGAAAAAAAVSCAKGNGCLVCSISVSWLYLSFLAYAFELLLLAVF